MMTAIFEALVEKTLSSSKTMIGLARELLLLAEEVKAIKESMVTFAKAIQLQQAAIDSMFDQEFSKTVDPFIQTQIEKKEKPN